MPFRNPKDKWYISEKQWPKKNGYYPTFAFGPGCAESSSPSRNTCTVSHLFARVQWQICHCHVSIHNVPPSQYHLSAVAKAGTKRERSRLSGALDRTH